MQAQLERAAKSLGLSLTSQQLQALEKYAQLIQKWNKTYNITALKDPEQIRIQHLVDSLSLVKPLTDRLAQQGLSDHSIKVIDVGSGGGLPGVVLAISQPSWQVICVDAVEKKTTFITLVSSLLSLPNLKAHHGRIEDYEESAQVVTSRAFASLVDFAQLAGHLVSPDGMMVAMKGKYFLEEVNTLEEQTDWQVQDYQLLQVPELNADRCLIWMRKKD